MGLSECCGCAMAFSAACMSSILHVTCQQHITYNSSPLEVLIVVIHRALIFIYK